MVEVVFRPTREVLLIILIHLLLVIRQLGDADTIHIGIVEPVPAEAQQVIAVVVGPLPVIIAKV